MKTHEHPPNGESKTDSDDTLDQYPVEVLEAVPKILKGQQGKPSGVR